MPFPESSMVDEGWDPLNTQVIRVDVAVDGLRSLASAASALRDLAGHLERLEQEGWAVDQPFKGGCAQLSRV